MRQKKINNCQSNSYNNNIFSDRFVPNFGPYRQKLLKKVMFESIIIHLRARNVIHYVKIAKLKDFNK